MLTSKHRPEIIRSVDVQRKIKIKKIFQTDVKFEKGQK